MYQYEQTYITDTKYTTNDFNIILQIFLLSLSLSLLLLLLLFGLVELVLVCFIEISFVL